MLLDKLKIFDYETDLCKQSGVGNFYRLYDMYANTSLDSNERIECCEQLCISLWKVCVKFNVTSEEIQKMGQDGKFLSMIEFLSATLDRENTSKVSLSETFYLEKGKAFVIFLNILAHYDEFYSNDNFNFMDFYGKLSDVMESLKWIFEMENNDTRVFPIHRLLDGVLTRFEANEDNLLQLIFSLQIFNKIEDIKSATDIKNTIIEIGKNNNIKILDMLCSSGELLMSEYASFNGLRNGTLIARCGDSILIRNQDEEYFNSDPNMETETNSFNKPVAYFVTYDLKPTDELVSFREILLDNNNVCKQKLLSIIMEQKLYNVFLPHTFIVDSNSREFIGVVNKFGFNDRYIINGNGNYKENEFDMFLSTIAGSKDGIRSSIIRKNKNAMNIITLDFIVEFYKNLSKGPEPTYIERIFNYDENSFYQNQMYEHFIETELTKGEIKSAIEKYYNFIYQHIKDDDINEDDDIGKRPKLIMPYSPYLPFNGDITSLYQQLIEKQYFPSAEKYKVEKLEIRKGFGNKKSFFINNELLDIENIYDIEGKEIADFGKSQYDVFYSAELNEIIYLGDYENIEKIFIKIQETKSNTVINDSWLQMNNKIDVVMNLVDSNGFSDTVFKFYGSRWNCYTNLSIVAFKLFWHIQLYQMNEVRYSKFEHLILDKFYTNFILNKEKILINYIEKLAKESKNMSLLIAKENDGEGATLNLLIEKQYSGERGPLRWAFASDKICQQIEIKEGKYYFNNEDTYIKKIVFLTDNIILGGSTERMLNFYLKNIPLNPKRAYLKLDNNKTISKIVKANNPKIVIHTIFCCKEGKDSLINKWKDFNLEIVEEDLVGSGKYSWDKEVEELVKELYGETESRNERFKCIFRPYNLPADRILPEKIKNTDKLIGIFRRKEEN